ncbi:hypothetical protein [Mucilaginibacter lacusdianchii]|uniref:hypothetical protein n=1 Tax=Mucilaginibacter lacusdianchii TaxID=2684211 RepID=UPI00131E6C88|nr:hypothetical protein [Mucilaginibacter sp. JXJ CY 39]
MGIIKYYTKLSVVAAGLLLTISSCKKDEQKEVREVNIDIPSALTLTYGEEKDLAIPADLLSQSNVDLRLDFSENENVQVNADSKLYDKLAKAFTVDRKQGKIHVNSGLIYPNSAVSSTTGKKLPDSYKVTVIASSSDQTLTGKKTVAVTVTLGKFNIKGLDNKNDIPFAYVLYSDAGATFELEAPSSSLDGATWNLDAKTAASVVSLNGNKVQFKATAGDPNKKAEQAYDLASTLKKDGFEVASRQFRVVFIPQIKFFYGTYYPEYDLTLLLNQVYIALSNAYVSSAPTLYPDKYKSSFVVTAIEKDGKAFDNKDGILAVDEKTGVITVEKNTTLTEGSYKLTVKAVTTTGLEFTSTMTLNMAKLEE